MIMQLLTDTSVSGSWAMVVILSITAFLLVRILNRIERTLERHDGEIRNLQLSDGRQEQRLENLENRYEQ